MTIFASRERKDAVKVSFTFGPVSASIEEYPSHLRYFHTQLGELLDAIDAEQKAEAAE